MRVRVCADVVVLAVVIGDIERWFGFSQMEVVTDTCMRAIHHSSPKLWDLSLFLSLILLQLVAATGSVSECACT